MSVGEERHGFGPKLPDIENAKETIRTVVSTIQDIFAGDGFRIGKRVTIEGPRKLNVDLSVDDTNPSRVRVVINEPLPRVNLAGWIRGDITGATVSEDEVVIEIANFPDVTFKVVS